MPQSLRLPIHGLILIIASYLVGVRSADPTSFVADQPWVIPACIAPVAALYVATARRDWRLSSLILVIGAGLMAVQFYSLGFRHTLEISGRSLGEGLASTVGPPLFVFGIMMRSKMTGRDLIALVGIMVLAALAQLFAHLNLVQGSTGAASAFDLLSALLGFAFFFVGIVLVRRTKDA